MASLGCAEANLAKGVRASAALHLEWANVDLSAGVIRWPAATDKMGREWLQPIRRATLKVFDVANSWLTKVGYTGPWVIFSRRPHKTLPISHGGQPGTYRLTSLVRLSDEPRPEQVSPSATTRTHGFQRMVASEVYDATQHVVAAMEFIGDTSIRMADKYTKKGNNILHTPIRSS